MEFLKVLEKRRSVRAFLKKEVEGEKLEGIIDAALKAPSAGNLQSYKIAVVREKRVKEELCRASYEQDSIVQAPVVLVFLADGKRSSEKYGRRGAELYALQDATIAAAYAQLEAANEGLGSVWIGAFEDEMVAKIIGAEAGEIPVAIIPVGYPAEKPGPREAREKKEMVRRI